MPAPEVSIERAAPAALNEALVLLEAQFAEHHIAVERVALRSAVSALCDGTDRGALLLARHGGKAVAIGALTFTWSLEHGGRVAWLEELYVAPDHRCKGLGARLLNRALAVAREAGCRAVDLEVAAAQARAEHLYRRAGFTSLDRHRWALRLDGRQE